MADMAARRILLIDDDEMLRKTLAEQLSLNEQFEISEAATGAEGISIAQKERLDAILLDVSLPDADGRNICRTLRQIGVQIPIIMLTALHDEQDTIHGLDAGANDYIFKPFRFGELLARLRAQLRQYEHSEDASLYIGPYTFKPAMKLLLDEKNHKKIRLTEKETAILKYLYRSGSNPVSKETLLGNVWGYNADVTTHTLETHVYRLRQKIEADPANAHILLTDQGGYRLAL